MTGHFVDVWPLPQPASHWHCGVNLKARVTADRPRSCHIITLRLASAVTVFCTSCKLEIKQKSGKFMSRLLIIVQVYHLNCMMIIMIIGLEWP